MNALETARRFVEANYPFAPIAILGGSAATGDATPESDLDILVILDDGNANVSFVETTTFENWLIESFVYGPNAAARWLELGRDERRPVLDTIAATGIPLTTNLATNQWQWNARATLAAGPKPLETSERDARRYTLSALLDDLKGSTNPGESYVIESSILKEAAELTLFSNGCWLGTGKWLIRSLAAGGAHARSLARWASSEGHNREELSAIGKAVLAESGGYLQGSFVRGERPRCSPPPPESTRTPMG